ncbi:MAG TPA: cbb3-type cytochrome c oxidase subunit I, partial [Myxococcota bacterium]|nr:cbb3-type cytochrome c oxidase subunit I [Myxococcota bacterium]
NGLLTLRGAWNRLQTDAILKFFVVGVSFYGMSTFEGPMMSIRSVNAVSHYTDWTIGHVHGGALGWVGMVSFAMLYYMVPRLWKRPLYSDSLATTHFWLATVGIVLYLVAMWTAGITQWSMWKALDENGQLLYPNFLDTVLRLIPFYWIRFGAGLMYLTGLLLMAFNLFKTATGRAAPDLAPSLAK